MADLDHFKSINDTYGHAGGDAVLREVAERMKASFRSYDAIGRYGGEEFLIALPGCALPAARNHAERLREALASTPFYMGSSPVQITCSIGVACDDSPCGAAVDTLVRNADSALYKAKNGGRNRVETYARNASRAASGGVGDAPAVASHARAGDVI
jgi:diguanylate cyclase (GGDEF)-like protein